MNNNNMAKVDLRARAGGARTQPSPRETGTSPVKWINSELSYFRQPV